jgi:SAM-dependent methyltransferase
MSQSSSGAPGWQLEGNAPLAYDTHIVDVFLQDYSRRLVEVAAIKQGDRVLDVACGTGVVTRLVANKIGSAGDFGAKRSRPSIGKPVFGSCEVRTRESVWDRSADHIRASGQTAALKSRIHDRTRTLR